MPDIPNDIPQDKPKYDNLSFKKSFLNLNYNFCLLYPNINLENIDLTRRHSLTLGISAPSIVSLQHSKFHIGYRKYLSEPEGDSFSTEPKGLFFESRIVIKSDDYDSNRLENYAFDHFKNSELGLAVVNDLNKNPVLKKSGVGDMLRPDLNRKNSQQMINFSEKGFLSNVHFNFAFGFKGGLREIVKYDNIMKDKNNQNYNQNQLGYLNFLRWVNIDPLFGFRVYPKDKSVVPFFNISLRFSD